MREPDPVISFTLFTMGVATNITLSFFWNKLAELRTVIFRSADLESRKTFLFFFLSRLFSFSSSTSPITILLSRQMSWFRMCCWIYPSLAFTCIRCTTFKWCPPFCKLDLALLLKARRPTNLLPFETVVVVSARTFWGKVKIVCQGQKWILTYKIMRGKNLRVTA